jgi:TRAP transporter TAXI family solute receptor
MQKMKKLCALTLALSLALGLTSCSSSSGNQTSNASSTNAAASTASSTAAASSAQGTEERDWTIKEQTYISMVSTPMGQSSYTTAAALCDLATSLNDNLEMISEESNGYGANVSLLISGEAEFGMTDALALQQGYNATDDYAGYEAGQVVGVSSMNAAQMAIIVRADSDIYTIDDIRGKRVGIGQVGGTSLLHALNMLEAAGIDPDKDIVAYRVKSAEQAEMMKNDQLDVYIWCGSYSGSAQVDLVTSLDCRVIVPDDELIDKIIAANPCYFRTEIPGGAYPGYDDPIPTFGSQTVFFCRTDVPDEVIYQITKALYENLDKLSEQSAGYRYCSLEHPVQGISVPIHPGAQAYYEEVGASGIAEHVAQYPLA